MIIALLTVVSVVGLINSTSFSLAMSRQGHIAGSASAFLGILPFAGGALVSPLTGILGENNMIPMGLVIFCCSLCALIIFLLFVKKTKYNKLINKKRLRSPRNIIVFLFTYHNMFETVHLLLEAMFEMLAVVPYVQTDLLKLA